MSSSRTFLDFFSTIFRLLVKNPSNDEGQGISLVSGLCFPQFHSILSTLLSIRDHRERKDEYEAEKEAREPKTLSTRTLKLSSMAVRESRKDLATYDDDLFAWPKRHVSGLNGSHMCYHFMWIDGVGFGWVEPCMALALIVSSADVSSSIIFMLTCSKNKK